MRNMLMQATRLHLVKAFFYSKNMYIDIGFKKTTIWSTKQKSHGKTHTYKHTSQHYKQIFITRKSMVMDYFSCNNSFIWIHNHERMAHRSIFFTYVDVIWCGDCNRTTRNNIGSYFGSRHRTTILYHCRDSDRTRPIQGISLSNIGLKSKLPYTLALLHPESVFLLPKQKEIIIDIILYIDKIML